MSVFRVPLELIERFGSGLKRPEGVMCASDGSVWTVDEAGPCVRITADGAATHVGNVGGKPNGICIERDGAVIVANIAGGVQRLHADGHHDVVAERMADGRRLTTANFPFADAEGRLWVTNSTARETYLAALKEPGPDGTLCVIHEGECRAVADGLWFANGVAVDAGGRYVYVAESTARRVVRFAVKDDGSVGPQEPYGPELGPDGHPDGIAFDVEGNLWVTLPGMNALGVLRADGGWEIAVEDPEGTRLRRPTNICFGSADLRTAYVGSLRGTWLARFRVPIAGMPLVHQTGG